MVHGKTRFSRKLIEESGSKAFNLSALKAIFPDVSDTSMEGSINSLFDYAATSSHYLKPDASSEFEKLIFLCFMTISRVIDLQGS